MQIEKNSQGDLLELVLHGRLDNDSSVYFRQEIEARAREGWHRVLVDLSGVDYLSSSGIAAPSSTPAAVRAAGRIVRHSQREPRSRKNSAADRALRQAPRRAAKGAHRRRASTSVGPVGGYAIVERRRARDGDLFPLRGAAAGLPRVWRARVVVRCARFADAGWPTSRLDRRRSVSVWASSVRNQMLRPTTPTRPNIGEILAVAGAVAQSADQGRGLPDYLVAAGDFVPSAQFRYGISCDGELPLLDPVSAGGDRIAGGPVDDRGLWTASRRRRGSREW